MGAMGHCIDGVIGTRSKNIIVRIKQACAECANAPSKQLHRVARDEIPQSLEILRAGGWAADRELRHNDTLTQAAGHKPERVVSSRGTLGTFLRLSSRICQDQAPVRG